MRWISCTLLGFLLYAALAHAKQEEEATTTTSQQEGGILECVYETNSVACARQRMAKEMDRIEVQITGRGSDMPISKVIEESGSLLADGIQAIFGDDEDDDADDSEDDGAAVEESRKKKFGKKKKKHLHKLLMIGMLVKSKISLLLQLLSTHFQVKFFVIAIFSLMINAARFWIDLKKGNRPSKVIYYEHAQHQHHYDHDDDHGLWGRSSDEAPQELAYNAYAPEH